MWYTWIAMICLVLVILWNPVFEHMTNADIAKKVEFHASKPSTWKMPNPEETKNKLQPKSDRKKADPNLQIYGPTVPPVDPNAPKPIPGGNGKNGSGVYPAIFGPDSLNAPGHKSSSSSSSSNADSPLEYDFLPAAEFPAGPSEPAPFLNDFSKLLKA